MITVVVSLPPGVSPDIIDAISVSVLDNHHDRQPRGTFLEGIAKDPETTIVTFTTT